MIVLKRAKGWSSPKQVEIRDWTGNNEDDAQVRALADQLYRRVDWDSISRTAGAPR